MFYSPRPRPQVPQCRYDQRLSVFIRNKGYQANMNSTHLSASDMYQRDETSDPLGVSTGIVEVEQLRRWSQTIPKDPPDASHLGNQEKLHAISPFPVNTEVNSKIILWRGSPVRLNVHAIVNSTNETLSDNSPQSHNILMAAGPQLLDELKHKVKGCRTGDAKITKGFLMPSRYIIHTVGPKYNSKYQTAAESALFSCYFKTLGLVREHKIATLALPAINSIRRGYPPHEGAHIAIRTVHRFLEKHSSEVDAIIFSVDDVDVGIYELLLPLYFPRNLKEQEYALYYLPLGLGGENGEPFILERQIRIVDKPLASIGNQQASRENLSDLEEGEEIFVEEEGTDLAAQLDSSVCLGKTAFAKMHGDVDKKRKGAHQRINRIGSDSLTSEVQRKNKYERLLRKARTEDLRSFASLRCLYQCGEDRYGRPVVVFVGHRLSLDTVDLEKAVLYLINTLDSVVQRDYSIVYFHTLTTAEHHPSLQLLRQVYDILDYKYKKNLRSLYIIHPTFWTRLLTWWFTTFSASTLKNKVHSLGGVEYLHTIIPPEQLDIPQEILEFDRKVNGVNYYHPMNLPNSSSNSIL